MTEAEWLAADHGFAMWMDLMYVVGHRPSDRKKRLYSVACCRKLWRRFTNRVLRQAVDVGERFADGLATQAECAAARKAVQATVHLMRDITLRTLKKKGTDILIHTSDQVMWCRRAYYDTQAAYVRDLVGNPFKRTSIDPSWVTADVTNLAQAAYDNREMPSGLLSIPRLTILADALEDAGCTDVDILDHLRGEGPHIRGCWAVDMCLDLD